MKALAMTHAMTRIAMTRIAAMLAVATLFATVPLAAENGLMYFGTLDKKLLVIDEDKEEVVGEIPMAGVPRITALVGGQETTVRGQHQDGAGNRGPGGAQIFKLAQFLRRPKQTRYFRLCARSDQSRQLRLRRFLRLGGGSHRTISLLQHARHGEGTRRVPDRADEVCRHRPAHQIHRQDFSLSQGARSRLRTAGEL